MRTIVRLAGLLALVWLALLFSGYGVIISSTENAAGMGLECRYLTARDVVTRQFIHTDSGLIGVTACPLLHKVEKVVD
ncbi:YobH family protein [Franconibacter pulveris 601]|uniref:YobH family protein n=1 Tax=Franconibacter pulveris TaxID=435910 RepID=UPI0004670E14|nr:YobH family protein [Franconibacter pulveris]